MVKKDDTHCLSLCNVSGQVRKLLPTIEHYKEQEGYSRVKFMMVLQAKLMWNVLGLRFKTPIIG